MDREVTEVVYPVACGLDVHSAIIVACLVRSGPNGRPRYEERSFPTALRGLRELRDWLLASGCQAVGMEATGVYWMPVFAALEGHIKVIVGNPNHMKNLRGHKTDRTIRAANRAAREAWRGQRPEGQRPEPRMRSGSRVWCGTT